MSNLRTYNNMANQMSKRGEVNYYDMDKTKCMQEIARNGHLSQALHCNPQSVTSTSYIILISKNPLRILYIYMLPTQSYYAPYEITHLTKILAPVYLGHQNAT